MKEYAGDQPADFDAAKIALLARQCHRIVCGGAAELPKADFQIAQIGRNPIRTFAARQLYVLHAGPFCHSNSAS